MRSALTGTLVAGLLLGPLAAAPARADDPKPAPPGPAATTPSETPPPVRSRRSERERVEQTDPRPWLERFGAVSVEKRPAAPPKR